ERGLVTNRLRSTVSMRSWGASPCRANWFTRKALCATPASARVWRSPGSMSGLPVTLFDDSAAQAAFTLVQHHLLAWRHRALRFAEFDPDASLIAQADQAFLVGLPVAGLGVAMQWQGGMHGIDPVDAAGAQCPRVEQGVLVALYDYQHITGQILVGDIPG